MTIELRCQPLKLFGIRLKKTHIICNIKSVTSGEAFSASAISVSTIDDEDELEMDDTFGASKQRKKKTKDVKYGIVAGNDSGVKFAVGRDVEAEIEDKPAATWTKGAAEAAPWGEFVETAEILKAPQVRRTEGSSKNKFKGRKKKYTPADYFATSHDHANSYEVLKVGVLDARGKSELVDFLSSKAQYLKHADMRKLLEACLEKRQPRKIFDILSFCDAELKRPLGSRAMTQMISICGKYGEVEAAQKLFNILAEKTPEEEREVHAVNALMNAYGRKKLFAKSEEIMDHLRAGKYFVKPDAFSYTSGIAHAMKSLRYERVISLFEEMTEEKKYVPDIVAFGTAAFALCRIGKPWLAEALLKKMAENRIAPDTNIFNTIMSGYVKLNRFNDALRIRYEMEKRGCKFSEYTYSSLMHAYGKQGDIQEVEKLYVQLLRSGGSPTAITFNSLIECYTRNGEMEKAEAVVGQMTGTSSPTIRTLTCLMIGYSGLEMYEKVEHVFHRIQASSMELDEHCCSLLVSAYLHQKEPRKAESFLENLWRGRKFFPLESTNLILAHYADMEDEDRAISLVRSAEKYGQPLDVRSFQVVIEAFFRKGRFMEMEEALRNLIAGDRGGNIAGLVSMAVVRVSDKLGLDQNFEFKLKI